MSEFESGWETRCSIGQGDGVIQVVPRGVQLEDHMDHLLCQAERKKDHNKQNLLSIDKSKHLHPC